MKIPAGKGLLLFCGALVFSSSALAVPLAGQAKDMSVVLHPAGASAGLLDLVSKVMVICQTLAVAIVIAGLLVRIREDGRQMETIAGMMIRVAIIATIPLWQNMLAVSSDLLAEHVGAQAILKVRLAEPGQVGSTELAPLQEKLQALEKQWSLDSSPVLDVLEDAKKPGEGEDDLWLGRSWNWARSGSGPLAAGGTDASWAVAAGAERAAFVHRFIVCVLLGIQASQMSLYFAELLRLQCFLFGFALMPLFVASLGLGALDGFGKKALQVLGLLLLWPLGWALAHTASLAMLTALLDLIGKELSSALNPKVADDATRTLAMALPYLSWSNLLFLGTLTTLSCLWIVAGTFGVPLVFQWLCSAVSRVRAA